MNNSYIVTTQPGYTDYYTKTLRPIGEYTPNDYSTYVAEGWDMRQYVDTGKGWLAHKLKGFGEGMEGAYINLEEYWDLKRVLDVRTANYNEFEMYLYAKSVMQVARKFQQACDYYGFDAMTTEIWNGVRYWQKNFDSIRNKATQMVQRRRAFCHSIAREQGERYNETWER